MISADTGSAVKNGPSRCACTWAGCPSLFGQCSPRAVPPPVGWPASSPNNGKAANTVAHDFEQHLSWDWRAVSRKFAKTCSQLLRLRSIMYTVYPWNRPNTSTSHSGTNCRLNPRIQGKSNMRRPPLRGSPGVGDGFPPVAPQFERGGLDHGVPGRLSTENNRIRRVWGGHNDSQIAYSDAIEPTGGAQNLVNSTPNVRQAPGPQTGPEWDRPREHGGPLAGCRRM